MIIGEEAQRLNAMAVEYFVNRFVDPKDRARVAEAYEGLVIGQRAYDIQFRIKRTDGAWCHLREIGEVLTRGNRPDLAVGSVTDVTIPAESEQALREARIQAIRAERAISDFLAHMSHELRTPLNAIIGFSQIMETEIHGAMGDPRYRQYVTDIKESGMHLLHLVNDVLNLSTAEAGRLQIVEEKVDLGQIVGEVLDENESMLNGHMATYQAFQRPLHIFADVRLVKRALTHLLRNAIMFSIGEPEIRLTGGRGDDGSIFASIEDNGEGMTEEEIRLALKPFGQTGGILASEPTGTGLGLPYARVIMERHQGALEVRSAPRQGTTVTLRFPPQRTLS